MPFEISVLILYGELGIVFSECFAMALHCINLMVKFSTERACVHHALVLLNIFSVCGHVYDDWMVLGQTCFEVCFLPLVFFKLTCQRRIHSLDYILVVLLFLRSSWKAKKLKVHALYKVKVSKVRLIVYTFRMIFFNQLKWLVTFHIYEVAICVIVST